MKRFILSVALAVVGAFALTAATPAFAGEKGCDCAKKAAKAAKKDSAKPAEKAAPEQKVDGEKKAEGETKGCECTKGKDCVCEKGKCDCKKKAA